MVNLGDVPARRNHYARFAFTNTGPSPIEIRELQTSCGCLSDHLEKRIFAAGETGELLLRIQTANQNPGKKEYTCRVITGPPDQADIFWSTDLVFRVILPEQSVTLNPRALIVHQYTNEPTRHVVRVHDTRSRTLTARQVTCNAPFVTARLLPASSLSEQDTDYGVVEQVEVVVSATPPGQHDVVIRVLTDDREFSVVKIPVRVYGPSPPDTDPSESSGSPDGTPPFVE